MDRGAWQATVRGVAKSLTGLTQLSMTAQEVFNSCIFSILKGFHILMFTSTRILQTTQYFCLPSSCY